MQKKVKIMFNSIQNAREITCMHLISLAFWIELNMIFNLFCLQVITMCSVMSWTLFSPSSACR